MQLVELQETLSMSTEIAGFAISYDPVDVLAAFADANGIEYSLLADVGSVVIEELGLLNRSIVEDQQYWGFGFREDKHGRLPHPGVFVLDDHGVVVDRRMERSHRNRHATRSLLARRERADACQVSASAHGPGVTVSAGHATTEIFPNQVGLVHVDLEVESGTHVFVPPTGPGYTVLDVSIDAPEGVYWDSPAPIEGEPFSLPGVGDALHVAGGVLSFEIPFHVHESHRQVSLAVTIRYQACTATECFPPSELRLELPLTVRPKM